MIAAESRWRQKSYVLAVIGFPVEVLLARNVSDRSAIKTREILLADDNCVSHGSTAGQEC